MKNITLWLDSDGLVYNWVKRMIELINHPEIKTQDQLNKHPKRTELIKQVYHDYPFTFLNLDTIPEGVSLVRRLQNLGVEFKVLTAIGEEHHDPETVILDKKMAWETTLGVPFEDVIVVPRSEDKLNYIQPGDILVDDYHKNVMQWNKAGGVGLHFDPLSGEGLQLEILIKTIELLVKGSNTVVTEKVFGKAVEYDTEDQDALTYVINQLGINRTIVNVVKALQQYPGEGVVAQIGSLGLSVFPDYGYKLVGPKETSKLENDVVSTLELVLEANLKDLKVKSGVLSVH